MICDVKMQPGSSYKIEALCLSYRHPSQERSRRPQGGHEKDTHQQHGSGVQACSIDGLPCLPEFELWLQSEPGKAEACINTSDDIQHAISAYEQSAASGVRLQSVCLTHVRSVASQLALNCFDVMYVQISCTLPEETNLTTVCVSLA